MLACEVEGEGAWVDGRGARMEGGGAEAGEKKEVEGGTWLVTVGKVGSRRGRGGARTEMACCIGGC